MARSDLLKKLFRGYKAGDNELFLEAAREIVEEERKKAHVVLANDLTRILDNGRPVTAVDMARALGPLPRDSDRGGELAEILYPDRFLADLVLSEDQRTSIEEILREFRQWEVLEANGLRPRHKLLFCGPPGCGKTVTAEALAGELGLPLLYVRFDAVVSSLLGETAANLRKVFDYAARGVWVVLFDEFDAIGRSRDDATEHGELKRVVNTFLQLLDRYRGQSLVIAATNFERALDPALWRRFDEIIRFEKPDRAQIEALLRLRLTSFPWSSATLEAAASRLDGMTHAEVERICLDVARRRALSGGGLLTEESFEQAIKRQERRQQALLRSRGTGLPTVDQD